MQVSQLEVEAATAANVAPYGVLFGVQPDSPPRHSSFYGDAVELWSPGVFRSDQDTCLSLARVHPRTNEVVWMERHFKHTQTFVPLGGAPFVVVLGAPTEGSAPDPRTVRALRFDGSAALMMHIGTWHEFPFAIAGSADMLVVLRNETNRDLELRDNDEAVGGDLEKRNMRARLGLSFRFQP
jgi:ureidoglycolate lyase